MKNFTLSILLLIVSSLSYAQVNVSINWNIQNGEVKKEHLGLVVWSGIDPSVSNNQLYQDGFNFANPGLVRFHSNQMTENNYTDNRGWIDYNNEGWHYPTIQDALDNFNFSNFTTLLNIPRLPYYLDTNKDKVPDNAAAQAAYANLCADLVIYVNQTLGYNVQYWTPINEMENAFSSNITHLGSVYNDAITAMKQADSNVLGGSGEYSQPYDGTLTNFLNSTENNTDFVCYHQYGTGSTTEMDAFYYDKASNVSNGGDYMRSKLDNLGWNNIPLWLTETNMFWTNDVDVQKRMRSTKGTVWQALLLKQVAEAGTIDGFTSFNDRDSRFGIMSESFHLRPTAYLMNLKSRFLEGMVYSTTSAIPTSIEALAVQKDANTNAVLLINRSGSNQTVSLSGWAPSIGSNSTIYTINTKTDLGIDEPYTGYSESSATVDASFGQNISIGAHSIKLIVAGTGIGNPNPNPSGESIKINFGTSSNNIPADYIGDTGAVYTSQNDYNYGWDVAQNIKNRGTGDPLNETCVRIGSGSYWEIDVPNGNYEVTVGVGDTYSTNNTIVVEGVSLFQSASLAASEYATNTETVTVNDGKLTLNNGSSADKTTRITYLDIIGNPTQAYVDSAISISGTTSVNAASTYTITVNYEASEQREVAVYLYNTTTWNKYGSSRVTVPAGNGIANIDVTVNTPPQGNDYQWTAKVESLGGAIKYDQVSQWCAVNFADNAISVSGPTDVEAGQTYTLTVDYEASTDREVAVYLYNTSSWYKFGQSRVPVSMGNGTVDIDVTVTNPAVGTDYQWTAKVESIGGITRYDQTSQWSQVVPSDTATPPANNTIFINFGTDSVDQPTEYIGDKGLMYGAKNGYDYGWNVNQSVKNRNTGDILTEAIVRIAAESYWEIEVPNGNYYVTIGIGDLYSTNNTINIEEGSLFQNVALAAGVYQTGTITTSVSDGYLTLDNGSSASLDTRITHAIIAPITNKSATISKANQSFEKLDFYFCPQSSRLILNSTATEKTVIEVYSLQGQLVKKQFIAKGEKESTLRLSTNTVYLFHVYSAKETCSKKFIAR